MKAPPSPLSSRAKPRDLQFRGLFLEMFERLYDSPSTASLRHLLPVTRAASRYSPQSLFSLRFCPSTGPPKNEGRRCQVLRVYFSLRKLPGGGSPRELYAISEPVDLLKG